MKDELDWQWKFIIFVNSVIIEITLFDLIKKEQVYFTLCAEIIYCYDCYQVQKDKHGNQKFQNPFCTDYTVYTIELSLMLRNILLSFLLLLKCLVSF